MTDERCPASVPPPGMVNPDVRFVDEMRSAAYRNEYRNPVMPSVSTMWKWRLAAWRITLGRKLRRV